MKKQECKLLLKKEKGNKYYRINAKELLKMFMHILKPSDIVMLTKHHVVNQDNKNVYCYTRYSRFPNQGNELTARQKQWNLMKTIYKFISIPYVLNRGTSGCNIVFRGMEICVAHNTPFVIFRLYKENPFSYYSRPFKDGIMLYDTRTEKIKYLPGVTDLKYVCYSLKEYGKGNKTLVDLDNMCTIPFTEINGDKIYEREDNN